MRHKHNDAIYPNGKHNRILVNTIFWKLAEDRKHGKEQEDEVDDSVHTGESRSQQNQRECRRRARESTGEDYRGERAPKCDTEQGVAKHNQRQD